MSIIKSVKVSELPDIFSGDFSSVFPTTTYESNSGAATGKLSVNQIHELFSFKNSFNSVTEGIAGTKVKQMFHVYTDSTKLRVNQYLRAGNGASIVVDDNGIPKTIIIPEILKQVEITVESFADLRTFKPWYTGQKVRLLSWNKGNSYGGGIFVGYLESGVDDGGTIAAGTGFRWERAEKGKLTILDFGGVPSTDAAPVDIAAAFALAKAVTPIVVFPANGRFYTKTPLTLIAGQGVKGEENSFLCSFPATTAAGAGIVSIIVATGVKGITLANITLDGGVREINTTKNYTRPVKITNCTDIIFDKLTIINNADWSFSIESCSNVRVTNYTQKSFVYANAAVNLNGGRDGSHFMDCINVVMDTAYIDSGDDCVGITSKLSGCRNIQIRNITGSSKIASIVIYNEEQDGAGVYYSQPCDTLDIENIKVMEGGKSRDVVRVYKYGADSVISNISVKGITGAGTSHGAYFGSITNLYLSDIDVSSSGAHGVYIIGCRGVYGNCKGLAVVNTFQGVSIFNSSYLNLDVRSDGSTGIGCQLNGVTFSTITVMLLNCGAELYATNAGGGIRIVNCSDTKIPSGIIYGDPDSVTYIGVNVSGTQSTVDVDTARILVQAKVPFSGVNGVARMRVPLAALHLKEDSTGALIIGSSFNCSVVKNAVGDYTFTIGSAAKNTFYYPTVNVCHMGAVRNWKMMAAWSQTTFRIGVVDSSGTLAYSDHVYVIFYDAP